MNKIICDICGTSYPDSAECCPICGSSREYAVETEEMFSDGMPEYIPETSKKGGKFSAINKRTAQEFYDFDAPESDVPQDVFPEEGFSPVPSDHPRPNMFAVSLLTVIIAVFLLGTGYLFLRYQLPNRLPQSSVEHVTQESESESTEFQETTEPTIPCESLVLMSGVPEIDRIGRFWLLHVTVTPENTTDDLTYVSSDENVVTVTEEGRLCAVGEGEAVILITCGKEQISCTVTVRIPEETEASDASGTEPDAQPEPQTEPEETEPTKAQESVEPAATQPSETTQPTTQTTVPEESVAEVVLSLKESDLTFTKKGVTYELELDCDLDPKDVKWMTINPNVAICRDGVITVVGNGTTRIYATYQGQEVYCIVRCNLK